MVAMKPHRLNSPKYPVCAKCGSDDVQFDARAIWDTDNQRFEVGPVFDDGHVCEPCGKETEITWRNL